MARVSIRKKMLICLAVSACICLAFALAAWANGPTATVRQLTTSTSYGSHHGDWSPDGQWIVFQRSDSGDSRGSIFKIRADGTGEVQLTEGYECDSKPRFSPDGKKIAFQRYDAPAGTGRGYDMATIWVMGANGKNQTKLVDYMPQDQGGAQWPSWSPDGRLIAFWYGKSDYKGLYIVNANGGFPQPLPTLTGIDPHMFIEWKKAGIFTPQNILVSVKDETNTFDRNRHMQLISLGSPAKAKWITDPTGNSCQWYQKWSPDGKKIAYTDDAAGHMADIWVMSANGSNRVRLTDAASTDICSSNPGWNPNGRYIIYWASVPPDVNNQIKRINIMTADGKHNFVLMADENLRSDTEYSRYTLSFNRQGTRVLFQGDDAAGRSQLYVIDLNTNDDDNDGLLNWEEDVWGTSRTNPDTDGDRVNDGAEVRRGRDPTTPGI